MFFKFSKGIDTMQRVIILIVIIIQGLLIWDVKNNVKLFFKSIYLLMVIPTIWLIIEFIVIAFKVVTSPETVSQVVDAWQMQYYPFAIFIILAEIYLENFA